MNIKLNNNIQTSERMPSFWNMTIIFWANNWNLILNKHVTSLKIIWKCCAHIISIHFEKEDGGRKFINPFQRELSSLWFNTTGNSSLLFAWHFKRMKFWKPVSCVLLPFKIEFTYKNENFAEIFLYFILLLLPGEIPSSMMGEKILESKSNKKLFLIFFI